MDLDIYLKLLYHQLFIFPTGNETARTRYNVQRHLDIIFQRELKIVDKKFDLRELAGCYDLSKETSKTTQLKTKSRPERPRTPTSNTRPKTKSRPEASRAGRLTNITPMGRPRGDSWEQATSRYPAHVTAAANVSFFEKGSRQPRETTQGVSILSFVALFL